jgi:hypothetical protein
MLKMSEHNDGEVDYVTNLKKFVDEMNQKFIDFLYSDRVRIRYLMHPDAHFTEEELRSGQYISVSEFNDYRRKNDKEYHHRSFHRKKPLIGCSRSISTCRFLTI